MLRGLPLVQTLQRQCAIAPAIVSAVLPTVAMVPQSSAPVRGFAVPASTPTMSGTAKSKLEKAKRLARKKTAAQLIKVRQGPVFHLEEAIRIVKAMSQGPYDHTVDFQVQLGIDPRKTNQAVRGVAQLPFGSGKKIAIAVFAKGEKAEEARRAGASIVGAEDLVERIQKGELNFNKTIATPDMMPLVGRIARVSGVTE
jgi:ribosomal protein L1